jgi:fructuronate reductase
MRYVTGVDEQGEPIEVKDPLAGKMRAIADGAGRDAVRLVVGLLTLGEVFGKDLPPNEVFREAVTKQVKSLFENGSAATVAGVGK